MTFGKRLQSHCLTYAFPTAAAKGQIIVHFCHLIGHGPIHREPIWIKGISIAPVSCVPAGDIHLHRSEACRGALPFAPQQVHVSKPACLLTPPIEKERGN